METWSFVNNNTITALHVQFRIYRRVESGLASWLAGKIVITIIYSPQVWSSPALLNVISPLRSNNFDLIVLYHNISCEEISSFL